MTADDPSVHVEIRHRGRRWGAEVRPNGSTSVVRDGVWVCNGDWNGRALDTGDNELDPDLDTSNAILEALAAAIRAATDDTSPATRPGRDAYPSR